MSESPLTALDPEDLDAVYTLRDRSRLRHLPRGDRGVARLFDGRRTLAQICADSGVSITHGISLADRLARLDLLVAVPRERSRAARSSVLRLAECSSFSESEEAFFASEVQDDEL